MSVADNMQMMRLLQLCPPSSDNPVVLYTPWTPAVCAKCRFVSLGRMDLKEKNFYIAHKVDYGVLTLYSNLW